MQKRPLGKTGLQLSTLSFGASPLGGVFGPFTTDENCRAVRAALDAGINFFDTAPFYGATRSETELGIALSGVPRDSYVLSSKVARYGPNDFDFSPETVTRTLDESLARLKTDHLDLVIIHDIEFGDLNYVVSETIPAMRKAIAAGKARFLGVSGFPLHIFNYVLDRAPLDFILSYCHYTLCNTTLTKLFPRLEKSGVGLINAAALSMGLLTDRPVIHWHPAPPALREAAKKAAQLCNDRGHPLADIANWFSTQPGEIATTLTGMNTAADVARNLNAVARPPAADLLAEVQAIFAPVADIDWPSGKPENRS